MKFILKASNKKTFEDYIDEYTDIITDKARDGKLSYYYYNKHINKLQEWLESRLEKEYENG